MTARRATQGGGATRGGRSEIFRLHSRLRTELKLTPDQVAKIKPIVENSTSQAETYHREVFQRLQAIFDASDDAIKAQLTSEQVTKFEQLKARRRKPPELQERK